MTARGWGYSSCVFSVQMFPLSLPNDLDIKSCRFPVVNLPRGTSENMHSMALAPALQILTQNIINKHNSQDHNNSNQEICWRKYLLEETASCMNFNFIAESEPRMRKKEKIVFLFIITMFVLRPFRVWFWHFVNIFEFHFWRRDEWDEFDQIL